MTRKSNLSKSENLRKLLILAPLFGTILFAGLYLIATFYYPGGSQFDKNSIGFSWTNNYWCNLLNDKAINGQANVAQPIALTAMFILCLTLTFFWWQFPKFTSLERAYKLTIQICGALAMTIGFFLFTTFDHDLIINFASLFGLIATTGTFIGLYKNGWTTLFAFGFLNIGLVVANNILYYNKEYIFYLPSVQKITFATFLLWVCCIDIKMFSLLKKQTLTEYLPSRAN